MAVVNESLSRRFLPKEDPLDKHFGLDVPDYASTFRIVGVVQRCQVHTTGQATRPMFFVPSTQHVTYKEAIMQRLEVALALHRRRYARDACDRGALEPALRKTFADADPEPHGHSIRTMRSRWTSTSTNSALLRASRPVRDGCADPCGCRAVWRDRLRVAQRTSEIGVRMALGADRTTVIDSSSTVLSKGRRRTWCSAYHWPSARAG